MKSKKDKQILLLELAGLKTRDQIKQLEAKVYDLSKERDLLDHELEQVKWMRMVIFEVVSNLIKK